MGLFDKKYCCLCGAQAKMLRREKLGDGAYICNACRDKCSADVSFHRMDSSSVQTHIEQSAEDQRIIAEDFRMTDYVDLGSRDKTVLAIDGESGCFYIPLRERPDIITFDKVYDYRLKISTHRPEPDENDGPDGRPGRPGPGGRPMPGGRPGPGRPGMFGSLMGMLEMFSGDRRLPRPMPGEILDDMKFVITLRGHEFIEELEIDILPYFNTDEEVRNAYMAARDMLNLFDSYHEKFAFAGE